MTTLPYFEVSGPEGQSFRAELQTDRVTIGRFEQWNDIALFPDPQQLVSRKMHCIVEYLHHAWWVVDNGSVNCTFLRRKKGLEMIQGRAQLHDKETICILGMLFEEDQPKYWELTFHDPASTNPAGYDFLPEKSSGALAYHWTEARLYRLNGGKRQEINNLRPQEHKLIRYMAHRNRVNGNIPVLCTFDEIASAVWGEEVHPPDADLAHLIWQLRKKIEPDYKKPQFLETVRGLGYRLLGLQPAEQDDLPESDSGSLR
jgi:DNA-binding winged helix-turn-helix (wHTH) protein